MVVCRSLFVVGCSRSCRTTIADDRRLTTNDYSTYYFSSGFGDLSPICRTLPNSSFSGMPLSVSNKAGTCAAILVMSPVILFIPAESRSEEHTSELQSLRHLV